MTLKVNIHIFGLTKCTIYCKKCFCFVPVFLYAVTKLMFQIKRIISREKWFNYIVTFFYLKTLCKKIWVSQTTLNGEKKEDSLKEIISVMDATFAVVKRKPEKIQACKGFEPLT